MRLEQQRRGCDRRPPPLPAGEDDPAGPGQRASRGKDGDAELQIPGSRRSNFSAATSRKKRSWRGPTSPRPARPSSWPTPPDNIPWKRPMSTRFWGPWPLNRWRRSVKTCAELLNPENRQHLKRANVDEIVVRGEHLGNLLASATVSPGLPRVFSLLLSPEEENKMWKVEIPSSYIGKTVEGIGVLFEGQSPGPSARPFE